MIDKFIDYFVSFDFLKDIFLILLGALLSAIYTKGMNVWKYKRVKRILKRRKTNENIITIDSAFPAYEKTDIVTELADEAFYLSIPIEELEELRKYDPNYRSREEKIFTKTGTLSEIGVEMDIPEFATLVQKHKKIVARLFVDRVKQGQELFNNEKFGIKRIIRSRTASADENSLLRIRFYTTDYYTHRVMRSVFSELEQEQSKIAFVNELNGINKYYPFMTSLGVNSLLSLEDENFGRTIVLTKRTKAAANMVEAQWHVSMNEGVNTSDAIGTVVSLEHCVARGFEEELGIRVAPKNEFTDLFLVRKTFEVGIASVATTNMTKEDFEKCYSAAQDRALETLKTHLISDNVKDIKRFMKDHENLTAIGDYCLSMYIGRKL